MRRFYLENAAGDRVGLNGETGIYLQNPTGLGITLSPASVDLGHGFFAEANEQAEPQTPVVCDLIFTGNAPYAAYQALADWLAAAGTVYVCYAPGGVEYRRRTTLSYLTKTELGGARWITCPAAFLPLTPWYRPVAVSADTTTGDNALVLDMDGRLLDSAVLGETAEPGQSAAIAAGGHIATAFELRYTGQLVNPVVRLVGAQSGNEYGRCALAATIADGETLIYSTQYDDARVQKLNGYGVLVDLLGAADLAYDPFPRAPVTETCTLILTSDTALSRSAAVTIYYYYRTV